MKRFFTALFALGIVVLSASPASSHSAFIKSNPERDSVIQEMPAEFRLEFNEDLLVVGEDDPNQLTVTDKNGEIVSGPSEVAGPFIFAKALSQDFVPGKYKVDYRIVSADGHVLSGNFEFQLKTETKPKGEAVEVISEPLESPSPIAEVEKTTDAEHAEHENFIHVHSDHLAIAVIALIAIGSWFLYRKINNY